MGTYTYMPVVETTTIPQPQTSAAPDNTTDVTTATTTIPDFDDTVEITEINPTTWTIKSTGQDNLSLGFHADYGSETTITVQFSKGNEFVQRQYTQTAESDLVIFNCDAAGATTPITVYINKTDSNSVWDPVARFYN